jgi:hypothetical protein
MLISERRKFFKLLGSRGSFSTFLKKKDAKPEHSEEIFAQ